MKYKRIINSRDGKPRYLKNGKLIKKDSIPQEILEELEESGSYDPEEMKLNPPKKCMICGQYGKMTRFVNLKVVVLCEEHYNNLTLGKVVQLLREKEHATSG